MYIYIHIYDSDINYLHLLYENNIKVFKRAILKLCVLYVSSLILYWSEKRGAYCGKVLCINARCQTLLRTSTVYSTRNRTVLFFFFPYILRKIFSSQKFIYEQCQIVQ